MNTINTLVLSYGLMSLTHLFVQINLAHAEYLKKKEDAYDKDFRPSVCIVVPSYNESYRPLRECIISALSQDYGNVQVVLIDDGSKDDSAVMRVAKEFKGNPSFSAYKFSKNKGKRHAQKAAFDIILERSEIIVTVDSDTIIAPDGMSFLVQDFKDPKIGAVTGNIRAIRNQGLLTRLIDGRYFSAFNQERAAQSYFGTVLCCSGPFSAYRSRIISVIKKDYVSQYFLGEHCTYGDDRHLTNLVLNQGYRVKYEPRAQAITYVPNKLRSFFKQQVRWNKSFYREMLWTLRFFSRKPSNFHPYILYDLTMQAMLPALLVLSLAYSIYRGIYDSPMYFLQYSIMVFGIALIRTMYSFVRTKDRNLLLFPIYSFLHIFLLIPARIYAILSMKSTRWGTR